MKRIHKTIRIKEPTYFSGKEIPICRVDNKTFAWAGSSQWRSVTCKNCLEKR